MRRWSEELKRGDHVVHIFHSDIEQAKVLLDLLRWLSEDEKLILMSDSWEKAVFRHHILDAAVGEGRMAVLPARSLLCPTGHFHPDAALDLMLGEIEQAREEGYSRTVMVWDGNWTADLPEIVQDFITFESQLALNWLPAELTLICQYDARVFSPEQVELQRRVHQLVLEDGRLDRNFWVVSTSALGARVRGTRSMPSVGGTLAFNEK